MITQRGPRLAVVANMPSHHQVDLFNALADCGMQVKVFYLRTITPGRQWRTQRAIKHDHVFVPEYRVGSHVYFNFGLLRKWEAFQPDISLITQYASVGMQVLMYSDSLRRRPWVFWSERPGVEWSELPILTSEPFRRLFRAVALVPVARWPAAIWPIGRGALTYFLRFAKCQCEMFPYYSNLAAFRRIERGRLGGTVRFLFVGKLIVRKGIDIVCNAADLLAEANENFELEIVGDGELREQVAWLVKRWPGRVRWSGFVELDEVPSHYERSDVLLCPSRYDGWGMVIPQALAAGMPVISTRRAGAALEMITNGETGYLVEPGEVTQLAASMRRFCREPGAIEEMGRRGRGLAVQYEAPAGARELARRVLALAG